MEFRSLFFYFVFTYIPIYIYTNKNSLLDIRNTEVFPQAVLNGEYPSFLRSLKQKRTFPSVSFKGVRFHSSNFYMRKVNFSSSAGIFVIIQRNTLGETIPLELKV